MRQFLNLRVLGMLGAEILQSSALTHIPMQATSVGNAVVAISTYIRKEFPADYHVIYYIPPPAPPPFNALPLYLFCVCIFTLARP